MSNPIKPTVKTEIITWLMIIMVIAGAVYFYNNLPERIITHWNYAGVPDGYGSSRVQTIFLPLLIIGMYILFLLLPYLDPKRDRYEQFAKVYHVFKAMIVGTSTIVFFVAGFNNLGFNLPVGIIVPGIIGVLFIILGNYMAKIKMNWFMGIRTPWTMSSEEVWNKTHRFGGKMFILAGLLLMVQNFLPVSWRLPVFIAMLIVLLFGTMGYSYIVYLQEKKKTNQIK